MLKTKGSFGSHCLFSVTFSYQFKRRFELLIQPSYLISYHFDFQEEQTDDLKEKFLKVRNKHRTPRGERSVESLKGSWRLELKLWNLISKSSSLTNKCLGDRHILRKNNQA